jgi:cephalosporin-C deacetylase-like acetyl esterase
MNAKLTPVALPANRTGVELFEYQADSVGVPSVGYFGRPIGAQPKSLPAVLFVPGAGVRSANLDAAAGWSKNGMLFIDLNAHGIADGQPATFYSALDSGELKDYRTRGRESRDTYYFLGVYFRVLRAMDFLTAQPEWDGKTLVISGVSQGGGLALAGAALEPRVTYVIAVVPGLSDQSGIVAHRIGGWPRVIPLGTDGKPDPKVLEALRYYDSVNFATRIHVPGHFEVGFLDVVCPATCSYAAYNQFAGKKEMVNHPNNGHDVGPQIWSDMRKLILAHCAEQAK